MDKAKMMEMISQMKGMISQMEMACSAEGYEKPEMEEGEEMGEDSGDKKKMFVAMMKKKMG